MKRVKDIFEIASLHRDDLTAIGFDGNSVDDSTMERLASKMCDDYIDYLFWWHLESIANNLGIKKMKQE